MKHDLGTQDKLYSDVVTKYLAALMSEASEIRTNTSRLVLGASAAQLAVGGWAVSSAISGWQKAGFCIGIVVFCITSYFLISKLLEYFNQVASSINKIDIELRAFEKDIYITDQTLLPKEWEVFGTYEWKEPIFWYGRRFLLLTGVVAILITICA